MDSLVYDSELLMQHVAAVPVPNSKQFVAVKDENGRLMIFSIGTDSKLYVSKIDRSGHRNVLDVGKMLEYSADYQAQAFNVVQDPQSNLYVALATARQGHADQSLVSLLAPFKPSEYDLGSPSTKLKPLVMEEKRASYSRIYSIYMVNSTADGLYPPVLLAYKTELYKSQDLASALVVKNNSKYTWERKSNAKLPENADKILAIQPLILKLDVLKLPGFITLYTIQGQKQLVFRTVNVENDYVQSFKCPSGAAALSAVIAADGFTDILIGGSGLYRFVTDLDVSTKDKEPELITKAGVFESLKQLHVTQNGSDVAVWATTVTDGVGYLETKSNFSGGTNFPVQVIPEGQGGYFAPFKAAAPDPDKFIVSGDHGSLTLLEQDRLSGIWKRVPLIQPSLDKTIEIQSYMTQIRPLDAKKAPLVSHPLTLRASGEVSVIVNGRAVIANKEGVIVKTDQTGLLMLTVPTNDISTHTFSISDTGTEKSLIIDPAHKINKKLSGIKTGQDLNITLPDGTKLLEGTKLKPEEINSVAKTISYAMNRRKEIADGKSAESPPLESCIGFNTAAIVEDLQGGAASGVIDMLWGAWHWLERQAHKIAAFVIQGANVVVKIADKVYRWTMTTVDQVGKTLSVIFNKILDIGKKVIQWLGFIFNWSDIRATKESIVNIAMDALEEGPKQLTSLKNKMDRFFTTLEDAVSGKRPSSEELKKLGVKADETTAMNDFHKNVAANSMSVNWSQYQFNHGGARDASTFLQPVDESTGGNDPVKGAHKELDKEFQNIEAKFGGKVKTLQNNLTKEYDPKGKRSIRPESAFEQLSKSLLVDMVKGTKTLAGLLLDAGKFGIETFQGILTQPINMPVFSSLYKQFISNGKDLTILDALAFVIAIPATIFSKLVTQEAPPKIPRGRFSSILSNLVNGTPKKDADFDKFSSIIGVCTFSIILVLGLPASILPASGSQPPATAGDKELFSETYYSATSPFVALAEESVPLGKGRVTLEHLIDACVFFYQVHSIPKNHDYPGFTFRLASWMVSLFNCVSVFILHFVSFHAKAIADKIRAVIDAILQAIVFALSTTASVLELATKGWKGKNDVDSGLDIAAFTFLFIGAEAGALQRLTKEDPEIELIAMIVKYSAYGLGFVMIGTKVGIHIAHGNYKDIPFLGDA